MVEENIFPPVDLDFSLVTDAGRDQFHLTEPTE
jgi:hypothetical protein